MKNIAYFFITAISIVIVLVFGKTLLIPFVFAILLWFVIREIRELLDKIPFVKKRFALWAKNLLTSIIILSILGFASGLITANINALAYSYPKYEANVGSMVEKVNKAFNIDVFEYINTHSGDIDFGTILRSIFNSLSEIFSSTFMILIYVAFIFLEEAFFRPKLANMFADSERFDRIMEIIKSIEISVAKYLGLKTLVSFITGVLSYFVLLIIGIDSPVFWAFLIFLLNFIPTIGSLIGTLFPAVFCLLQFGEISSALLVLFIVGAIQIVVGNVLEPKLMGSSMNLSALVTILALSFWGAIWGITGMILSIPITVIMVIIFSQFPSTKAVAIMLSEKGEV
ncbi:AI-2E family transporter [Fulvivirga sp. RKSG066]|uniref:AI-2E family transporter n=1 Tax=Fulvivirga aurantia TaxID=2529383 RepID=UPI0012BBC55D|nr:AI-2E family transporter [Fulvivirga aurantia]MTI22567.1 AI-2E family transporter [Fulvivirga aurantia]